LQCVDAADERIERLEVHMSRAQRDRQHKVLPAGRPKGVNALLEEWHLKPVVLALMGFRGYQTVAAMITVSEPSGAR
jgi:hypothetical protein